MYFALAKTGLFFTFIRSGCVLSLDKYFQQLIHALQSVKLRTVSLQCSMAYCCVPCCRSDWKQKIPGVSFHEIPAEETARQEWIRAIRREDWEPNTTSNYSRVCSRHFKEADFTEGKRRRLKKGVVPSVFPEYPSYLRPHPVKVRSSENIKRRSAPLTSQQEDEPTRKRKRCRRSSCAEGSTSDTDHCVVDGPHTLNSGDEATVDVQQLTTHVEGRTDEAAPCTRAVGVDQATQVDVRSNLLATERKMEQKGEGFDKASRTASPNS